MDEKEAEARPVNGNHFSSIYMLSVCWSMSVGMLEYICRMSN